MATIGPEMSEAKLTRMLEADGCTVVERLDHWARTAGERTFFYYGEDDLELSYAEFSRRTDHIAGNLARLGVARGDGVSVFTHNALLSALMMFGIWKAGAVYCPVNFSYTGRLLSYQLNDTAPRLMVTDAGLLPAVNEVAGALQNPLVLSVYEPPEGAHDFGRDRVAADAGFQQLSWAELTASAQRPDIVLAFDDPANIVYTSGTTGPSKGVVQPHRWMNQYTFSLRILLGTDDVVYNDLPMYHVGGAIANVVRAAWVGCEAAVWNRFSPSAFWERIALRKVTTAILLDVMIPWLANAPEQESDRHNTLNKAHMQPLPEGHAAFACRFGIDFVTAGFGQTESGGPLGVLIEETAEGEGTPPDIYRGFSHARIRELAERSRMPVFRGEEVTTQRLIGLPAPFFEAAVVDGHDVRCAPGEPGQLVFRPRLPALIMQEYLGKPEKTVEAWRNLWFHTGDAAVQYADGMFAFVDRLGDRIRVRGENLSSFQVEDLLLQDKRISLAAVLAIPSQEGDEDDIVAFVVAEPGKSLDEKYLRAYAERTMPRYMRPRHYRIVEKIPRTPTNKIEKYKLRKQILAELCA